MRSPITASWTPAVTKNVPIEGGVLVANRPYNGTSVPNCCPSQCTVQSYEMRDERLVKLSAKRSAIEKGE
ncbi:MAG TPA: hypothetical protein VIX60_01950 [Candidatus Cybelea sp.]